MTFFCNPKYLITQTATSAQMRHGEESKLHVNQMKLKSFMHVYFTFSLPEMKVARESGDHCMSSPNVFPRAWPSGRVLGDDGKTLCDKWINQIRTIRFFCSSICRHLPTSDPVATPSTFSSFPLSSLCSFSPSLSLFLAFFLLSLYPHHGLLLLTTSTL